jgi:hypothetical protein
MAGYRLALLKEKRNTEIPKKLKYYTLGEEIYACSKRYG